MARHDDRPPLDTDVLLDAALDLIGRDGWRAFTLQALAGALDLPTARVVAALPSREAVLAAALRRVDALMLAEVTAEDEAEPPRDRLFDLLMRRLDAWTPHKAAVAALWREGLFDPLALPATACAWGRSLRLTLEGAGISTRGLRGVLRVKGLALVEARVLRVWLSDDSPDMAATLKCLDETLGRAEDVEQLLRRIVPSPV